MFRGGVDVGDDVDFGGELDVAADVITVRVRVDDRHDALVGDLLDRVEQRLPPARVLGVDHDHAVRGDEDGAVAAAARHHEQVVLDLLDLDHARRLLAAGGLLHRGER